jgi:hypothetical protein
VARSHYKGLWIGKTPMCAICAGAGEGARARHHLTHGVSVWLCGAHRSVEFQRRRGGRDFVASLAAVWGAAGTMTRRHDHALRRHLARVRPRSGTRELPGSYAWAALRREAERRFARGEDPTVVIGELVAAPIVGASRPTYRTLRRWFTDGRWLPVQPARRRPGAEQRPGPAPPVAATDGTPPPVVEASGPIRGPC